MRPRNHERLRDGGPCEIPASSAAGDGVVSRPALILLFWADGLLRKERGPETLPAAMKTQV